MQQYLDLCNRVLSEGVWKENRTGVRTLGIIGAHMQFDLADGFPLMTTKRMPQKVWIGEMLGFLRGYDNAALFRQLGCGVWDANANENQQWLNNPHRKGEDDLGRIYGVQARGWRAYASVTRNSPDYNGLIQYTAVTEIDQLRMVYENLRQGIDSRREIVSHWNPGEIKQMALPPCHMFYQFGIQGDRLDLSMYQRSCDMPLGVPFNIAGYAWLLQTMAHITGLRPGVFNHFLHDVHIYENQVDILTKKQLLREPLPLPTMRISDRIKTLEDLETTAKPSDFVIENYTYHPEVRYPFTV